PDPPRPRRRGGNHLARRVGTHRRAQAGARRRDLSGGRPRMGPGLGAAPRLWQDAVMIKLYGGGPTRWVKPYWTLKELDVPFEPAQVSIRKGETRTAAYKPLHP